jgi:hypothetical protein
LAVSRLAQADVERGLQERETRGAFAEPAGGDVLAGAAGSPVQPVVAFPFGRLEDELDDAYERPAGCHAPCRRRSLRTHAPDRRRAG